MNPHVTSMIWLLLFPFVISTCRLLNRIDNPKWKPLSETDQFLLASIEISLWIGGGVLFY
jgi:hypothetical protein